MSLEGMIKTLSAEASDKALEGIRRLVHTHRMETEEMIKELSERLARLEETKVSGQTIRGRKETEKT